MKVQITPVDGNLVPLNPTQAVAEATVPDSSLPLPSSYPYLDEVAFDFPNPPAVSASSEYAIVLTRSASSAVLGIGVKTDHVTGHGYPCPDGDLYDSPDATTPWDTNDGVDAVFSTFVGGAPTPSATGQRAAALKKCKKKQKGKARGKCIKKAKNLPV